MTKLLIVDDNKQITSILEEYAKKEGYQVMVAYDGEDAINKFQSYSPTLILLDVMLPKKTGFDVCREIRTTSNVPIIMITARGEDFEVIMGLDVGADDYIIKPFSPGEVMARVRAILRRITNEEKTKQVYNQHGLLINIDDYYVSINNVEVSLTKKEVEILWTLAKNHNHL